MYHHPHAPVARVQVEDAPFDADWQLAGAEAGEEDDGFVDDEDDDDVAADEDDGEELTFDAGGVGEYWTDAGGDRLAGSSYQQRRSPMLTASGVGLANPAGRGFMPSMLVRRCRVPNWGAFVDCCLRGSPCSVHHYRALKTPEGCRTQNAAV